jgi:hydroxymethylpyrimidine pyrophosphatase-like HAD family hydrolase
MNAPSIAPWAGAPAQVLRGIHPIVTDVDDTLTYRGRLAGAVLDALERLQAAGVRVVPATAASAGWASFMASLWPVDAVIAENGGVFLAREDGSIRRRFFAADQPDLALLRLALAKDFPQLEPADDQPYRESCLAFKRLPSPAANARVLERLAAFGARGTVNSLWLLAWPGPWDKLAAARLLFGAELEKRPEGFLYVGDSENDQAMFAALPHSVGVATVVEHPLTHWPRWITQGPGGAGFVEVAERIVAARG